MASVEELITERPYILLSGVSWKTYEGIIDALSEFKMRHTYIEGKLELRSVANGVPWESYEELLAALSDYHLPHYYEDGLLIMMSPLKEHDWAKSLINRMIQQHTYDARIPIQSIGSTTIYSKLEKKGFEADEAYYIANEPLVGTKKHFDPDVDPSPDLILEIDVTVDSTVRHSVYSKLGVPEIWQYTSEEEFVFWKLDKKKQKYEQVEMSLSFPYLSPRDFTQFIEQFDELREFGVVDKFVKWARKKRNAYLKQNKK